VSPPDAPKTFQILLVEDAPDEAYLLSALVKRSGPFEVTLAQDGLMALELARSGDFDLLITDLNLPGLDGFELTREVKRLFPELPVLAATGYTNPAYVEGAYRAGADALLMKPLDEDDLAARLRELLPTWEARGEGPPAVFALGARPGDVEFGCAGSLAAHRSAGHDVVVFVLARGREEEGLGLDQARAAAEALDVRTIVADATPAGSDIAEQQLLLERVVRDLEPRWAYVPTLGDDDVLRREAHRLSRTALGDVPGVLAYASATATLDFHPEAFRDVTRWMEAKLAGCAPFGGHPESRAELSPEFIDAHARYWGRFRGYTRVEPFEILKGSQA
jgi:CheY-like chemotaxis protein